MGREKRRFVRPLCCVRDVDKQGEELMSYCRLSPECDIYCYYHVGGYYEVWSGAGEHQFKTAKETVAFLRERREAGDKVPDHVFENLSEERNNA